MRMFLFVVIGVLLLLSNAQVVAQGTLIPSPTMAQLKALTRTLDDLETRLDVLLQHQSQRSIGSAMGGAIQQNPKHDNIKRLTLKNINRAIRRGFDSFPVVRPSLEFSADLITAGDDLGAAKLIKTLNAKIQEVYPDVMQSDNDEPERPAAVRARHMVEDVSQLVFRLRGAIGIDITSDFVGLAVESARALGVDEVVLDINTPGGFVHEAESIQSKMKDEQRVRWSAHCRDVISAGIWIAFAAETMSFDPSGTIGGALTYSRDDTTGNFKVSAKFRTR